MTDCDAHAATVEVWKKTAESFCAERDAARKEVDQLARNYQEVGELWGKAEDDLAASRKEAEGLREALKAMVEDNHCHGQCVRSCPDDCDCGWKKLEAAARRALGDE